MRKIFFLAWNTFMEQVRDRFLVASLLVAGGLFAVSAVLGAMTFDEKKRIMLHFGLFALHITLIAIAIFYGAYTLRRELDKQTCLMVLVRPVNRLQFLLGNFFGVFLLLFVVWLIVGGMLWLIVGFEYPIESYFYSCAAILIESVCVLAFALFASLVVQPSVALLSGLGLFLMGNWQKDFFFFVEKSGNAALQEVAKGVPWLIPQFFRLNYRSSYLIEQNQFLTEFLKGSTHVFLWLAVYVCLGFIFFRRKDLV